MTLTEFLLARIAEDEADAAGWPEGGPWGAHPEGGVWMDTTGRPLHGPGERVLAECEAKRRIVALASWSGQKRGVRDRIFGPAADEAFRHGIKAAMRALALPYASHPDYQQDWKP